MIGTSLGPYQVVAKLGEGGMGQVYRATDGNLKRSVAIKVLPTEMAGDADRLARFQREAEALAALNHPNVAAIYGVERTRGLTAIVMERAGGLFVQTLNTKTFALEGEPARVLESVDVGGTDFAAFSVSETGLLVFAAGASDSRSELTWYDRAGRTMGEVGTAPYQGIDVSHDGTRVAVHHHPEGTRGGDVFVIDLERNNTSTRLAFDEPRTTRRRSGRRTMRVSRLVRSATAGTASPVDRVRELRSEDRRRSLDPAARR